MVDYSSVIRYNFNYKVVIAIFKNIYLDLHMHNVSENYTITNLKQVRLWKSRGFEVVHGYRLPKQIRSPLQVTLLSKPLNIEQFGKHSLIGSKITEASINFGDNFLGLKLNSYFGTRWLVYCSDCNSSRILLDSKKFNCNTMDTLIDCTLKDVLITNTKVVLTLLDIDGNTHTVRTDCIGVNGKAKEYWLTIYDGSKLRTY